MNYFKYHGADIYDESRKVLESAQWEGFEIEEFEIKTDGTFVQSVCKNPKIFIHENKIYSFITWNSGMIATFFKLNMDKNNCLSGKNGVYYCIKNN